MVKGKQQSKIAQVKKTPATRKDSIAVVYQIPEVRKSHLHAVAVVRPF